MKESRNILISLHPKPDGDSLGSCTALKRILEKQGKVVNLFSKDELSENLAELDMAKEVKFGVDISEINWEDFDLVIFLDHANLNYYSTSMEDKFKKNVIINIDHHETNPLFGTLNYVDSNSPTACSVLIKLFKENNIEIDKETAKRLFLGVASDTGFFSYINANNVFEDAAFLSEKGVDYFNDIFKPIIGNTPLKIKKLFGILLNNLKVIEKRGIKIAYSFIKKEEVQKHNFGISDLRIGIDSIRGIKDVSVELVLYELNEEVKGSFRSSEIDTSKFAEEFGGGGHKLAAGFVIKNTDLKEAEKKVFDAIEKVGIHRA